MNISSLIHIITLLATID